LKSIGKASIGKASIGKASIGKASIGKASIGKARKIYRKIFYKFYYIFSYLLRLKVVVEFLRYFFSKSSSGFFVILFLICSA